MSAVEQMTVNQLVVGSIPTAGAKKTTPWRFTRGVFLCLVKPQIFQYLRIKWLDVPLACSLAHRVVLNTRCAYLQLCRHLLCFTLKPLNFIVNNG